MIIVLERCEETSIVTECTDGMGFLRSQTTPANSVVTLLDGRRIIVNDLGLIGVIPPMDTRPDGSKLFQLER